MPALLGFLPIEQPALDFTDGFDHADAFSRTALGAAALPLNVAVEINLIVEIEA